jgi:hypothetical protein
MVSHHKEHAAGSGGNFNNRRRFGDEALGFCHGVCVASSRKRRKRLKLLTFQKTLPHGLENINVFSLYYTQSKAPSGLGALQKEKESTGSEPDPQAGDGDYEV